MVSPRPHACGPLPGLPSRGPALQELSPPGAMGARSCMPLPPHTEPEGSREKEKKTEEEGVSCRSQCPSPAGGTGGSAVGKPSCPSVTMEGSTLWEEGSSSGAAPGSLNHGVNGFLLGAHLGRGAACGAVLRLCVIRQHGVVYLILLWGGHGAVFHFLLPGGSWSFPRAQWLQLQVGIVSLCHLPGALDWLWMLSTFGLSLKHPPGQQGGSHQEQQQEG